MPMRAIATSRRALLPVVGLLFSCVSAPAAERPRLFLEADTANEIDDLFAIARTLRQDRFELVGLSSTQWVHYLAAPTIEPGESTVAASQRLNEKLLAAMDRLDVPHPIGSEEPIGKPWGGFEPKDSPAARAIIDAARATPEGEKLSVVCLGASTNLATALQLTPEITPRVRAYVLGFRYDHDNGVWNKSSFNVRRDLNAADLLLNREGLELHIMPANVAMPLLFQRADTSRRCEALGELGQVLVDRWQEHCPQHGERIMWDLALVEAILRPESAEAVVVDTPPENARRKVTVYRRIDAPAMEASFWRAVTPAE